MEVNETPLPGVGLRHDFTTSSGLQVGVVSHHSGRRDIVVYDPDDPDAGRELISLTTDEADHLAELLGAPRLTGPLAELQQRLEGLAIDWLPLAQSSQYADRPLGDTQARTKTGVSIVAVVRDESAVPAPGPDFVFRAGDVLVVVGTPEGVAALDRILGS